MLFPEPETFFPRYLKAQSLTQSNSLLKDHFLRVLPWPASLTWDSYHRSVYLNPLCFLTDFIITQHVVICFFFFLLTSLMSHKNVISMRSGTLAVFSAAHSRCLVECLGQYNNPIIWQMFVDRESHEVYLSCIKDLIIFLEL